MFISQVTWQQICKRDAQQIWKAQKKPVQASLTYPYDKTAGILFFRAKMHRLKMQFIVLMIRAVGI